MNAGKPARFRTVVTTNWQGRVMVPVPFDPDERWGRKDRHHVAGTVNGCGVRAVLERVGEGYGFNLGPAWRRDRGVEADAEVDVVLMPEGPQRDDLAADVAKALDENPAAGTFFDSLAQFYRKGYLRWIDATKRSPKVRAQRIAEMVRLLEKRIKQR
jgi:hypothetical protein